MELYDKDRDHIALGRFYTDHVSAMTREGLHAKSDIAAELAYRDQRIATLEAEKAERERQEPVAWVLFDDIFIAPKDMPDDPPNLECMKPLYAHPLALREPTDDECREIRRLAKNEECDGSKVCEGRAMFNAVREVMK